MRTSTSQSFFSSRLSMLMPFVMKLPAMASMAWSGRPMPSKMPPIMPGPRWTDMGSFVGKTGPGLEAAGVLIDLDDALLPGGGDGLAEEPLLAHVDKAHARQAAPPRTLDDKAVYPVDVILVCIAHLRPRQTEAGYLREAALRVFSRRVKGEIYLPVSFSAHSDTRPAEREKPLLKADLHPGEAAFRLWAAHILAPEQDARAPAPGTASSAPELLFQRIAVLGLLRQLQHAAAHLGKDVVRAVLAELEQAALAARPSATMRLFSRTLASARAEARRLAAAAAKSAVGLHGPRAPAASRFRVYLLPRAPGRRRSPGGG